MLCPVCKEDMFVLEFEQVEIDFCFTCKGVWLDSGELEIIGQRAGAFGGELLRALEEKQPLGVGQASAPAGGKAAVIADANVHPTRKRRCPVCRRRLVQVHVETEPPIVVDRCPRGHGLWFDRGELSAVVAAAGAEEDNILARFLADLARGEEDQSKNDRPGRCAES